MAYIDLQETYKSILEEAYEKEAELSDEVRIRLLCVALPYYIEKYVSHFKAAEKAIKCADIIKEKSNEEKYFPL